MRRSSERAVAYLLDAYAATIMAVDLASGTRHLVTGAFGSPTGIALDLRTGNRQVIAK